MLNRPRFRHDSNEVYVHVDLLAVRTPTIKEQLTPEECYRERRDSSTLVAVHASLQRVKRNPSLYQINSRVLARSLGTGGTLADVQDSFIDDIARRGFDYVWLLGVWQTGDTGRGISRNTTPWRADYLRALPDCTDSDICGSPFAVQSYTVDSSLGGPEALAQLRSRLRDRGIRLILDFVPNHSAIDNVWTSAHPDFYIRGTEALLAQAPSDWCRVPEVGIVAHGRDPNYPGWPDTLQLNYFSPQLQAAMKSELVAIAQQCDGVRCDMAMLLIPEVFRRTWGGTPGYEELTMSPFWPSAISALRERWPEFLVMAEVYWGLEYALQQQGFSYTYDKELYDRVVHGDGERVRAYFTADYSYQQKMARFLENHDEPRIAATLAPEQHRAAAVLTFLAPGLRFIQKGQREGARVRIPVHLSREPLESPNLETTSFYDTLERIMNGDVASEGTWTLLKCTQAWEGNESHRSFVAFFIESKGKFLLVTVNFAPHQGQCFVHIPQTALGSPTVTFSDLLSSSTYEREALDVQNRGLYLDTNAWTAHVFDVTAL